MLSEQANIVIIIFSPVQANFIGMKYNAYRDLIHAENSYSINKKMPIGGEEDRRTEEKNHRGRCRADPAITA